MLKRMLDIVISFFGLLVLSPVLLPIIILIWMQDYHSPFYLAPRMARGSGTFRMVKLRSMVANADKTGVNSTSNDDRRITPVGKYIRKFKLDELMQLWNVLLGDMSLVGPRPQVAAGAALYTEEEKKLLTVRPGITDFASIVFSDEGDILEGAEDPDLLYNQIIRPWKSRLALLCIQHQSVVLDLRIIWLTALAILSRESALQGVNKILLAWGVD
ncbi:MAG: sugar transferase, partial [Magnetococcales bacterium]|nr:sugar transferase [Magnetococcales bacterium]